MFNPYKIDSMAEAMIKSIETPIPRENVAKTFVFQMNKKEALIRIEKEHHRCSIICQRHPFSHRDPFGRE